MPVRRPSASAGHANPIPLAPRAHRSNDSHHAFPANSLTQPPSVAYLAPSATPQQRIVQALINRINNKLPLHSGLALDIVEAEPATQSAVEALVELAHESLDIIGYSLCELLERLAKRDKQIDADGQMTTEALQSQLFILKILSVSMASRWNVREDELESNSPTSKGGTANTSTADSADSFRRSGKPSHGGKSRHASSDFSSNVFTCLDPFPLDDNCARYILSVMVLYLRQTAPPESRLMSSSNLAPDASLHDFESVDLPVSSPEFEDFSAVNGPPLPFPLLEVPKPILKFKSSSTSFQSVATSSSGHWHLTRNFHFEKTHMALVKSTLALNVLISRFAGRIVFHLSALNWPVVFSRIRQKIHYLANTPEDNPDTIDLQLMTYSAMDRPRLTQILHELSSLLVGMKKEAQAAVAIPLRMALWNWVDLCPHEYNEAVRSRGKLEGAPERVFDLLYVANEPGRERALWPTLTILACLSPDRVNLEYQTRGHSHTSPFTSVPKGSTQRKVCAGRCSETDGEGNKRISATRPKAKRFTSETLPDKDLLLIAVLTLWRTSPDYYIRLLDLAHLPIWIATSVRIWDSEADTSVKIAAAMAIQQLTDIFFRMDPEDPTHAKLETWMQGLLSITLICVAKKLLMSRLEPDSQRLWISIASQILEAYQRKSEDDRAAKVQLSPKRVPAFALAEIAFLVSLTSVNSEVSQIAAQALRTIAQAERHPQAPINLGLTEEERSKRNPIYEQLGDPSVVFVGRAREQKRVRKLLRLVAYCSPTNIAVWEECFWRWNALSEFVIPNPLAAPAAFEEYHLTEREQAMSLEEKFYQWRNLTLFLAAYGGATVQEQHNPASLTTVIPAEYLPDEMRALRDPEELVNTFIVFLTNALVDENVRVRDVAREALGSELSPRLFSKLFKHLDEITRNITEGAGMEYKEEYGLFLEQLISALKLLVENAQAPPDEALSVDLGSILGLLAGFISRFDDLNAYRIRVKFCNLCDSVCERTDTLTLRKDDLSRNLVLDTLMEWFEDPSTQSNPEVIQLQYDVNTACLKTAVKLLDRLKLQPIDTNVPHDGDDLGHAVSRIFMRYSQVLLRALEICQSDSILEGPVIANSENGVKHCIASAYDNDVRKRTIFVHVFARVLGKGTKFEPQGNPELQARRNQLRELVKGSDMVLAMVICECCPPTEVDMMISVLMNIFDTRASLMALLKTMIDREIAHTISDADLFRSNSTCTRFLSAFARIHGYNYLRSLISPLINAMAAMPPGHAYDLDPVRVSPDKLEQNQKDVEFIASSFLDIISASVPALPPMFREVCAHLAKAVYQVWPESKFAALGAFIFLRFISPAIVAPEIVDVELPKDDGVIRRGLMVIAKVVQNLANNIFFAKEAHMVVLNDFLKGNITNVTRYLSEVNKYSAAAAEEQSSEWLGTTADDTDTIVLHRFLDKHADKIGKELLSYVKPSNEENSATVGAKRAWDQLCSLLVELQEAPEVPRFSQLSSQEHRDFLSLMGRCSHRSIDPVRDIFVQADVPSSRSVVFVLRVCKIDVESLDIELLMYHILKTLTAPEYGRKNYEIILDCTSFTTTSEIPIQWMNTCSQLIPFDIRERFTGFYILNANSLTQKYLRRMYNVSAALEHPASLEKEASTTFSDVTMRQAHEIRMPVKMEVAVTHIRITSQIRAAVISPALSCRCTEIIPLSDISDAYNVSTGLDPNEFIIRLSRQNSTWYFSSQSRDAIVKAIRAAKSQLRDSHSFSTERFPRLSNVSATLLQVGMLNIDSDEEDLRSAAYDLLGAICSYLGYDKNPIITSKAGIIPGDISTFVLSLSDRLASFVPKLTLDFLIVMAAGMDKTKVAQRINCLQYMSPWVRNLALFCTPSNPLYEHSGARLRDCIRALIDLTVADLEIPSMIHKYVWAEIGRLDASVVNVVLDELIRAAADGGIGSRRCETIARTAAGLASINVRGKIFTKLRKVLGKTSLKPSRTLPENIHWNEIATLTRFALVASNHTKQASYDQLYFPDICHIVTIVAGTGQTLVRKSVYGIIMNFLQSLLLARPEDPSAPNLRALIRQLATTENLQLFGLCRQSCTSDYCDYDPRNDKEAIDSQEALTSLLISPAHLGLLNVWRARWMSLATSTAFQLPQAIQSRAFLVLGTLATSDVDDDLVYQMLVAFKTALGQSTETETATVACMLRCICRIVPALVAGSGYLTQLFWLAVALLQSSYTAFYAEAADLLRATVETLEKHGAFDGTTIPNVLLDGRIQLEDTVSQLDRLLCLSFESSFSFSLAAIIFKGVRHNHLKSSAEMVLRSLLAVTVRCSDMRSPGSPTMLCRDALGYFVALVPFSTTRDAYIRLLQDCRAEEFLQSVAASREVDFVPRVPVSMLPISDNTAALLTAAFATTMLSTAQGDDSESEMLYNLLLDVGIAHPDLLYTIYETLQDKIKEAFATSRNAGIIRTVSNIFRISQEHPRVSTIRGGSMSTLSTADDGSVTHGLRKRLEDSGMEGLMTSFQFLPPNRGQWTKIAAWISELVLKIVGLE
ncbi:hypothetical protein ID866_2597 [Astraeus odoratus]|nr:hypothetical protein ID866_2597 [Astraeus odoratus]